MSRRTSLLVAVAVLALTPMVAQARGYRRGGYVITPYGTMNTSSPEYRMAGGNPMVYQQLMQQKLMMQQQQLLMKQQQKYMQQMQKNQKKQQTSQPTQQLDSNITSLAPRKKKRRTYVPQSQQKTATETKAVDKTTSTTATGSTATKP